MCMLCYGQGLAGVAELTVFSSRSCPCLQLPGYRGTRWVGKLELSDRLRTGGTVTLTAEPAEPPADGCGKLTLELRRPDPAVLEFYLGVPYWLVNKTGIPLQVKVNQIPEWEFLLILSDDCHQLEFHR